MKNNLLLFAKPRSLLALSVASALAVLYCGGALAQTAPIALEGFEAPALVVSPIELIGFT